MKRTVGLLFSLSTSMLVLSASVALAAVVFDTEGLDDISGTVGPDVLYGLSGNDFLSGSGSRDVLHEDPGRDLVDGATGSDVLYGGLGADLLCGDDCLQGTETGDDILFGGLGNDELTGDGGDEKLYGQEGDDGIIGLVEGILSSEDRGTTLSTAATSGRPRPRHLRKRHRYGPC